MSKNGLSNGKVVGTDCYNCKFIAYNDEEIDPKILNAEGGIDPKNKKKLDRAEQADLIMLPGGSKTDVKNKRLCYNKKIEMYVTVGMCCV